MIRKSRDEWSGIWGPKHSINYGPHKHVQRGAQRDVHQEPRPKRLRMKIHFLEQPAAEILQSENVATPSTNKTPEDERRQNCQAKKDEARIHEPVLQRVHRFRGLDGRDRLAHEPPLNDVRDHEQVQKYQCERAPPTGLGFTNAGIAVAGDIDPATGSPRNRSSCFQFLADASTFHRVGEFTSKRAVRYRADGLRFPELRIPKQSLSNFAGFSLRSNLPMTNSTIPLCALSESTNNPKEQTQC